MDDFSWYKGNPDWAGKLSGNVGAWWEDVSRLGPEKDVMPSDIANAGAEARAPWNYKYNPLYRGPLWAGGKIADLGSRWLDRDSYVAKDPEGRTYAEAMIDSNRAIEPIGLATDKRQHTFDVDGDTVGYSFTGDGALSQGVIQAMRDREGIKADNFAHQTEAEMARIAAMNYDSMTGEEAEMRGIWGRL